MKRFSFNTFLAADGNRAALDICKRIADLQPAGPMPVLLLGEEGCGKTHLLYSIWKRVKASSPRTSLAVITAREFRREVRDLIGDPSPVEKAESAILLIDQLELFDDLLEELEAVVRIFLDNHHYVMLASNVHPRRLKALPQGLRDMIASGQTVEIRVREGETQLEILKREMRRESQAVIEKQHLEIERLRELLERVGAAEKDAGEAPSLDMALEQERAKTAELARQLEEATASARSLKDEVASLEDRLRSSQDQQQAPANEVTRLEETVAQVREELDAARVDGDNLRRELQRRGDAEEQVEHLRTALETAQSEKERVLADTVTAQEDERRRFEEERAAFQQQLHAAHQESAQARYEANMLVERAEKLVSQIETNQIRFRETEQEQRRQIRELEALLAAGPVSEEQGALIAGLQEQLQTAEEQLESAKRQFEQERHELADRLARNEEHLQQEMSRLLGQADEARRTLEQALSESAQLKEAFNAAEHERDDLRATLDNTQRERDDLRATVDNTQRERDDLRATVDNTQRERDDLRATLDNTQRERDDLRATLDNVQRERDDLRATLDNTQRERDDLRATLDNTQRERDDLRATLDNTQRERETLESALQQNIQEHETMRAAFEEARNERDGLHAALGETRNLLEAVRAELQQVEGRYAEQAAEMDALRQDAAAQVARANAQAGELEGKLAQLQARLARTNEAGLETARRLDEMRPALMASADALDQLCHELRAAGDETNEPGSEEDAVSWAPPRPLETPEAEGPGAEREERQHGQETAMPKRTSVSGPVEDDQFDDDRMVLPPAPDEEDIDPAQSEPDDAGNVQGGWNGRREPETFGLPETPPGPLEDLTPLEDEHE
ncbi:MAG TPA: DnaA/Hda family protein [Candidatus Hydrogenedentes bacterium]|nr:DnaA/Hda family protein [Candidatus Hydrogenedentota bacterium]